MSDGTEQLKVFTLQFFKELGATVREWNNSLEITTVPAKFQKFYGKNEPYRVVFDKAMAVSGVELITPESYLLKAMRTYLDSSGESVLMRLSYPLQIDTLVKNHLVMQNCVLSKASAAINQRQLLKFTFQTTYKYLNEEEKVVNDVYVHNGVIVHPNLAVFSTHELHSKDVEVAHLRDSYELAKNDVKQIIESKTGSIAAQLDIGLTREIGRINTHHEQQVKELHEQLARALKAKPDATKPKVDPTIAEQKLAQYTTERDFFIQNEQKKHSLRISTKLLTTAVMLYPTYSLELFFKTGSITRLVLAQFDPLEQVFTYPCCDVCKQSISEIILCNGNHIVCRTCGATCEDCGQISCETCLKQRCAMTLRKICKQCGSTCAKCKQFKNKRFMITDSIGRQLVCRSCS